MVWFSLYWLSMCFCKDRIKTAPAISHWSYRAVLCFKKCKRNGSVQLSIWCMISAKPSVPKCWVEGGELIGEAVSLHCKSAKGSTPLKYTWRRESADPIPAAATQSKCDLCWRHDATAHQSVYMYVCVGVGGGWGRVERKYLRLWEQNSTKTHLLFECAWCFYYFCFSIDGCLFQGKDILTVFILIIKIYKIITNPGKHIMIYLLLNIRSFAFCFQSLQHEIFPELFSLLLTVKSNDQQQVLSACRHDE